LPQTTINKAIGTTYANVWKRAFWHVLDTLRILCELGSRA